MEPDSLEAWASANLKSTFAVIGLGGAGSEAAQDLVELGITGVETCVINTDARSLDRVHADRKVLIGQRHLKGGGSGGDREAVLAAIEDGKVDLQARLEEFEIVFLVAGLGGGTGSALLPYLAGLLRKSHSLAIPVAFLPFHIELDSNPVRRANSLQALEELEHLDGLLLALSNEKLRRFESLPLQRVFHVRNTYLHRLVSSLVDMVENPSQLNVDLASLKRHLRDAGLSTLLYAEQHVSEPERLIHQALTETLLDFDLDEAQSPSALIHLDGGSNMTLRTLDRVLHAVQHRLGRPQRLMFGTRTHPETREVIRMTAVVGGLRRRTARQALSTAPPPTMPLPTVH
jgi:cell division protein FtsZ